MKRSFLWFLPLLLLSACQLSKKEPYTNRLVNEKSLYLRQHAHNPVDWYPWGEEALEKAKAEGKLLLISIGYASCHWCHVMEEETFSDTSVARFMNQYFVNIKVDREERPDVDDIYMTACQYAGNQSCGWPLNAFATPDGRPVWAGTYFPKKEWVEIVEYFADLYRNDPQKVAQYANELTSAVSDLNIVRRAGEEHPLSADTLASLAARFKAAADPVWGGRKGAPKFPMPNSYAFLLSYHRFAPDEELLGLIQTTLDKLAQGGIYDHLGGGFARYSVDAFWKVPHFEKMLYDNAQLISLYSQAYRLTRKEEYARLIRQTLDFIAREMTSPEGGFYASLDADSEGEEGTFYVWTEEQIRKSLGDEALSKIFLDYYQITPSGNWERGKNVLFAKDSETAFAREKGMDKKQLKANLEQARKKLFEARAKRPRPRLDEKVIASWNALMLEAYIEAWWALGDPAYLNAARKNAALLSGKMRDKDGGLYRTYAQGKASIPAFLDDYAFAIHAFITLYEATFEERWLQEAQALMDKAEERFWDEKQGVYFYAADDHSGLVARRAELNDNVMPASNSVMARNAFRMERFFPEKGHEARARAMLDRLWTGVSAHEDLTYFSNWSRLYLDFLQAPFEVAIVGDLAGVKRDTMLQEYLPNAVWMGSDADSELDLLKGKYREGKTQIYVCRNRVCRLPVEYTEEALGQMMEKWQE
jgi:uncharacterized protein